MDTSGKYDDIIHLSRPDSPHRARMSMVDRGAQFSPFAALVGLDNAIDQTARTKRNAVEFSQHTDELLEWTLQILQMQFAEKYGKKQVLM